METTLIIMIVAYAMLTIAVYIYMRREQRKEIEDIKELLTRMFAVTMSEHLRNNFEQINKMKEDLQELVNDERYEDAKRLRAVIAKQELHAMKALRSFQEEFGDKVMKLEVTKIGKPATNEEED